MGLFFTDPLFEEFAVSLGLGLGQGRVKVRNGPTDLRARRVIMLR